MKRKTTGLGWQVFTLLAAFLFSASSAFAQENPQIDWSPQNTTYGNTLGGNQFNAVARHPTTQAPLTGSGQYFTVDDGVETLVDLNDPPVADEAGSLQLRYKFTADPGQGVSTTQRIENRTINVARKVLTVTVQPKTKVYGNSAGLLTGDANAFMVSNDDRTISGLIAADVGEGGLGLLIKAPLAQPGNRPEEELSVTGSPYQLQLEWDDENNLLPNYTVQVQNAFLTVNKRTMTVITQNPGPTDAAEDAGFGTGKIYGESDPALTFAVAGLAPHDAEALDDEDITVASLFSTAPVLARAQQGTEAGRNVTSGAGYLVTVQNTPVSPNYSISKSEIGRLDVHRRTLVITPVDVTTPLYRQALASLPAPVLNGLQHDDQIGVNLQVVTSGGAAMSISGGIVTNPAGTYRIRVAPNGVTGAKLANYTVVQNEGQYIINPREIELQFHNITKTAGVAPSSSPGLDIGSGISIKNAAFTGTSANSSGQAVIRFKRQPGNTDQTLITVRGLAQGENPKTVFNEIIVRTKDGDDTVTVTAATPINSEGLTLTGESINLGNNYTLKAGGLTTALYFIQTGTIPPDQLDWDGLPATITYGGEITDDHLNAETIEVDGEEGIMVDGVGFVPGSWSYSHEEEDVPNAGQHTITATFTPSGENPMFEPTSINRTLTVNRKALTVVIENKARPYGESNPTLTWDGMGFISGENENNVARVPDLVLATTAVENSPVGGTHDRTPVGGGPVVEDQPGYSIFVGQSAQFGTIVNGEFVQNYNVTYVGEGGVYTTGVLTITRAPLNIIAPSASKVVGSVVTTAQLMQQIRYENPSEPTPNNNGLRAGDTPATAFIVQPSLAVQGNAHTNPSAAAGVYDITVSGAFGPNYVVTHLNPGKLTVQPVLNITAVNKSRAFNQPNPELEVTYSGGTAENLTTPVTVATTATASSAPGEYPITVTGGTSSTHHIVRVNGTLTVTKATPQIVWNNPAPIEFGTALELGAQLNASVDPLIDGELVYSPEAGTVLSAGEHTLTAVFTPSAEAAVNYNAPAPKTVTIQVTKAPTTVTWATPAPIGYNTPLGSAQLNATASVPGTFVYTPPAGTILDQGTHTLNVQFTPTDSSYATSTGQTTLTVTKATPVVTWPLQPIAVGGTHSVEATANVPGDFFYNPSLGTVFNNAGNFSVEAHFLPADLVNYDQVKTVMTLTVGDAPSAPTVTDDPDSVTVNAGQTATFTVVATGGAPLRYQWQKNGIDIVGETSATLVLTEVTDADEANYRVVVENDAGEDTSASASLTVNDPEPGESADDLNGDGKTDIVFQNADGFLATWFMDNENVLDPISESRHFLNPNNVGDIRWRVFGSGDFNGDGNLDIVFQHDGGILGAWYMDGINQISPTLFTPEHPGDIGWRAVAVADDHANNDTDVIFEHTSGLIGIWHMNGVTMESAVLLSHSLGAGWHVVGSGDFNSDGNADLALQNTDGRLRVWMLNGATRTAVADVSPNNPGDIGWTVATVTDLNNDGNPDLVFQHTDGTMGVWYMNGTNLSGAPRLLNPAGPGGSWRVVGP